jgi:peptide/nickel transport system permease protein
MIPVRLCRWARANVISFIGIVLALLIVIASLLAPVLAPLDPAVQDLNVGLSVPSWKHLFRTDQLGRDILSRLCGRDEP